MDVISRKLDSTARFENSQDWGFNVVRVCRFNSTCWRIRDGPVNCAQMRSVVDRAIDMATQAGIYVIVDMHGAPGRQSTDQCTGRSGQKNCGRRKTENARRFCWRMIADRYKTLQRSRVRFIKRALRRLIAPNA